MQASTGHPATPVMRSSLLEVWFPVERLFAAKEFHHLHWVDQCLHGVVAVWCGLEPLGSLEKVGFPTRAVNG